MAGFKPTTGTLTYIKLDTNGKWCFQQHQIGFTKFLRFNYGDPKCSESQSLLQKITIPTYSSIKQIPLV